MTSLSSLKNTLNDFSEQCYVNKLSSYAQASFTAGYSLRLLKGDYTGPMLNVRRSSDNATQDFFGDIQGNLGTIRFGNGQSLISWLNGSTAFVTTWYDQSGYNRPVTNTTNSLQPTLSTTGNIVYNGSSTYLNNTTPPLTSGIQKYSVLSNATTNSSSPFGNVYDHNASSLTNHQRVSLIFGSTLAFSGEGNDVGIIPCTLNVNYKSVFLMNSTLSTNNISLYCNGTLYQATTNTPASLNPIPYYLNIGRKSYGTEYFSGNINEVLFFNINLTANEALTYYSPSLITRKNYRSKHKLQIKGITRTPIPIQGGFASGSTSTNQMFVDSQMLSGFTSGNTISSWGNNSFSATAFNSPVYTGLSGYNNSITQPGYVTVSSTSSQYLDFGSKTFNVATNGGFTAVCYIKFNSFSAGARIFDFGNGQASDNILVGTFSTSGDLYFHMYNGSTPYQSTSNTFFATTGWNLLAFRYTYSSNLVEFIKNGQLINTNTITGANITNKSWTGGNWLGRSHWSDPYANWSMAGFYAIDSSLNDAQLSAVCNHLTFSSTATIPQSLPDYSRVKHTGSVLTYTGRTDSGVGTLNTGVNNYIDIQDVPALPFSYSYWFNSPANGNQTIVALCDLARTGNATTAGIQNDINSTTNFQIFAGLQGAWSVSPSFTITSGTWYHIVICVGISNNITVYFNGSGTNYTGTAIVPRANRIMIGTSGDGGRGSNTTISDFRVFDYILRAEEVTALYTNGEYNTISSITSKENYLVNYYNWYNIMIQQKTNGSTYSTFNMVQSLGDPNIQLQMSVSSQTSSNCIYNLTPIQNNRSFTCSFEIQSATGSGNCFYFFVGGTAIPAYNATLDCDVISGGYIIQFEEYQGNTSKGINFIDNTPVVKVNYPSTIWINNGNWYPVTISYTRGVIGTWIINFNGVDIITYSDTNNVNWLAQAGSYWGIGASNQGANSTKYIRRLELSYVPYTSSLGTNVSPQTLSKYPSGALTGNSTTLSDGTYIASASNTGSTTQPYYAFTNTLSDFWGELTSYSSTGVYTGALTTTVSSVSYSGEWLQIQMPNAITLYSYTLAGRQDNTLYGFRTPTSFIIAGSNNGSTWTLVDTVVYTNFNSQYDGNVNNYICAAGNTNSYTYFRMIIQKISNNTNASGPGGVVIDVSEWSLFAQNTGNAVTNKQTKIPTVALNANNAITFSPVTPFNWYTSGAVSTNGWTPIYSGSDPFGQLQLTDGSTSNLTQITFANQQVQNYPFTFTFQIYGTNNSNGDWLRLQFGNGGSATGVILEFSIFAYAGIRFYDSSGTLQVSSATNWYTSTWNEIRVVYNATAVGTWTIFFNGSQIIQYSDANFWNLIMNGGSTWGFYTFNGGAKFTSYIRQVNMDFNLSNNVPGTIQSTNSSLAGNYTITASNTRTDRDYFPYYVANNNAITVDRWGYGAYNVSTGAYTGGVSTTVSGVTQSGEWIQYQLPNPVVVSSFTLLPEWSPGSNNYMPRSFCLAGSVDGSTWVNLYDNTSVTWTYSVEQNFTVNNNGNKYSYYRLIFRLTGISSGNFNADWVFISRFDLFTPNCSSLSNAVGSFVVSPTTMTSNTLTISGNSNNLLNGVYTASASSSFNSTTAAAYSSFRGYQFPSTNYDGWVTNTNTSYNSSGVYNGGGSYFTTVNNISYGGEWIQLQVPNAVNINSFVIQPQQFDYNRTPVKFVLAGSNNGSTWFAIHIQSSINSGTTYSSNISWSNLSPQKFNCNQVNNGLYTYFRLIIMAINGGGAASNTYSAIGALILNTSRPKPSGLLDGLTWKFYDGANSSFSTSFYSSNPYINIGRCVDTSNYRTILNGLYQGGSQNTGTYTGSWSYPSNCSIELFGYFRPTVSGTWTFYIWTDDQSYIWIGNNALSGYTTGNANATITSVVSATTSFTISLIAGVYYPIRMQQQQSGGGVQMQLSFQPPSGGITSNGQGYFFSGNGSDQAFPQESAKIIKDLTNTNTDGIYYILVNGISTPTYCLMNDIYDGGGWMMLMKMSTNTQAFLYDSSYWKYINTLNASDVTRNTGDAKYNVFNYVPIKDILGIWPDINPTSYTNVYGNNGGSFFTQDGWTWLLNNWSSGSKVTGLSGFNTSRPAGMYTTNVLQPVGINNPFYYNGYGSCFSNETGSYLHYINSVSGSGITGGSLIIGTNSPGTALCNQSIRWGMLYNNETDRLDSCDAYQGIGVNTNFSAGDLYGCCGTAGINRSARFELFGR
jgi:hypothetical protein